MPAPLAILATVAVLALAWLALPLLAHFTKREG